jgi:hypothetical protein
MAIAWIKEIHNFNPKAKLKVRCLDNNRHPQIGGKEYGKDDWIELDGAKIATGSRSVSVTADNLAVPWSFGGDQRLEMMIELDGVTRYVSAEIRGRSGWDYVLFRDQEFRESGEVDVGSLGDAPGTNHSWWIMALHSDGKLEWHCTERQGLKREEAIAFTRFFLEFTTKLLDSGAGVIGTIVKVVAAVAA